MAQRIRIIGRGRAGGALGHALRSTGGYDIDFLQRGDDLAMASVGVDVVVVATPDSAIEAVAAMLRPNGDCVVLHLAGSLGLDVLEPHPRVAALHPLVSIPTAEIGQARLVDNAWFAVAGDPVATEIAEALGGRTFVVHDEHRAVYHATAAVAANHLVALLGQVERLARHACVPFEAFLPLALGALSSVVEVGPTRALTGPAARGDQATIDLHVAALPEEERPAYLALLAEARKLIS